MAVKINKMRHLLYFYIFIITTIVLSNCSKPDNESSLLEPAFVHRHLKSLKVNGIRNIEVEYSSTAQNEIYNILYYDNNGDLIPGYSESVVYENGRIKEKADASYLWQFSYTERGDLDQIIETFNPTQNVCTYTYLYNDTLRNLPKGRQVSCSNGYSEQTTYDYKNLNNRSYISFTTNNQDNSREIIQKTKFINNIINPLYELDPFIFDYYLDNIYQDFSKNEIYEYTIESYDGSYPLEVTETKLDPKTLNIIYENTYTYEYVK